MPKAVTLALAAVLLLLAADPEHALADNPTPAGGKAPWVRPTPTPPPAAPTPAPATSDDSVDKKDGNGDSCDQKDDSSFLDRVNPVHQAHEVEDSLNPVSMAGSMLCRIVRQLFAWPKTSDGPLTQVVKSLVSTPDFAQAGTNLDQVGANTSAVAMGLLALTMTFSILQFWLSGIVNLRAGMMGAEGIARGVGAALMIAMWPWTFHQAIALSNQMSGAIVTSGTQARLAKLLGLVFATPGAQPVSVILGVIFALCALLLVLGLLVLKMAMSGTLAVIFTAMPVLVVLWVVPMFSFLVRVTVKVFVVILLIPNLWGLICVVFTGLQLDALTFGNGTEHLAGVWGTILRPLESIVLLLMMVKLPTQLAKLATLSALIPGSGGGGGGGGAVKRAATNAAGNVAAGMALNQIPAPIGNKMPAGDVQFLRQSDGSVQTNSVPRKNWGGETAKDGSAMKDGVLNEDEGQNLAKEAESTSRRAKSGVDNSGRLTDDLLRESRRGSDDLGERIKTAGQSNGSTSPPSGKPDGGVDPSATPPPGGNRPGHPGEPSSSWSAQEDDEIIDPTSSTDRRRKDTEPPPASPGDSDGHVYVPDYEASVIDGKVIQGEVIDGDGDPGSASAPPSNPFAQ